jgi:hypothetical protein
MRKMTLNCLALGALLAAVAPAHADDQQISQLSRSFISIQREARAQVSTQSYGTAYGAFAQSAGFAQKTCSHVGGPKTGSWGCR